MNDAAYCLIGSAPHANSVPDIICCIRKLEVNVLTGVRGFRSLVYLDREYRSSISIDVHAFLALCFVSMV